MRLCLPPPLPTSPLAPATPTLPPACRTSAPHTPLQLHTPHASTPRDNDWGTESEGDCDTMPGCDDFSPWTSLEMPPPEPVYPRAENNEMLRDDTKNDIIEALGVRSFLAFAAATIGEVPQDLLRVVWTSYQGNALVTWGWGNAFITGHGDERNRIVPTVVPNIPQNVRRVAFGECHMLMLTNEGVWGCGRNSDGQLGKAQGDHPTPIRLAGLPEEVTDIVCGSASSYALSKSEIFAFGDNSFGQLGLGSNANSTMTPHIVRALRRFGGCATLAAGCVHAVFLCEDGKVYGCGDNKYGQLGLGPQGLEEGSVNAPVRMNGPDNWQVLSVVAEGYCTMILCRDGLYVCGDNRMSALGHPAAVQQVASPTRVLSFASSNPILSLSCTTGGTVFACTDGRVYAFGNAAKHIMGAVQPRSTRTTPDSTEATTSPTTIVQTPQQPPAIPLVAPPPPPPDHVPCAVPALDGLRVRRLCCGSNHTLVLCDQQDDVQDTAVRLARRGDKRADAVLALGLNSNGELGCLEQGLEERTYVPQVVEALRGLRIVDIASTDGVSAAIVTLDARAL